MSMKIILLIIAFQVVMGILAKRKARKAGKGEPIPASARKPEALPGSRSAYDRGEAYERDEDSENEEAEDEWEEHPRAPGGNKAEKRSPAPNLGKDILSQLAKELGLELPAPPQRKPAPTPRPQPMQPAAKAPAPMASPSPAAAASSSRRTTLTQRLAEAKRVPSSHPSRPNYRDGGESAPRRAPSTTPVTEEPVARPLSEQARESLGDAGSIRRAFILKTILDKPLSLQPRLPGRN